MRNKYGAKRTIVDGITFASKGESQFYSYLKALQVRGEILSFRMQVKYKLHGSINYISDFNVVMPDGDVRIIDFKGMETPVFKIKRKLFEADYGKLDVVTVKDIGVWPKRST